MKIIYKRILRASCLALATLGAYPAWSAGPTIVFSLKGKPVTSVPLDQLGEVTVTVNTGGAVFKQYFSGQWQGIDQSLSLGAKFFKQGSPEPSLGDAHNWTGYSMTRSGYDSNWATKNVAATPMFEAVYGVSDQDNVIFTARFRRHVYTGKTLYQNNAWVKETRWEGAGPTMGKALLKMEAPTFASSLNPNLLFAPALEKFNSTPANEYDEN